MRKVFDNLGRTNAIIPVDWKPGSVVEAVTGETFRYMEFEGHITGYSSEMHSETFKLEEVPFGD